LSIYSASVGSSSAGNELPGTSTSLSAGTEDYTLKVFTPDNGERTCNISCSVYTDNRKDLLVFKSQTVTIIDRGTSALNFDVIPGYISGKVTVNGAVFSGGEIYAVLSSGTYSRTTFSSDGIFSFPVQPNENIRVYGSVTVNGYSYALESQYVSVAENGTKTVNFSLNMGCISGKVSLSGGTLSSGTVYANNKEQCSLGSDGSFSLKVLAGENIT